jgi:hypothetical protein
MDRSGLVVAEGFDKGLCLNQVGAGACERLRVPLAAVAARQRQSWVGPASMERQPSEPLNASGGARGLLVVLKDQGINALR